MFSGITFGFHLVTGKAFFLSKLYDPDREKGTKTRNKAKLKDFIIIIIIRLPSIISVILFIGHFVRTKLFCKDHYLIWINLPSALQYRI